MYSGTVHADFVDTHVIRGHVYLYINLFIVVVLVLPVVMSSNEH